MASEWAMKRARNLGTGRAEVAAIADALDTAFLAGAKAMRERAIAEVDADHRHGDPASCLVCLIVADIHAIDPQTLVRPE